MVRKECLFRFRIQKYVRNLQINSGLHLASSGDGLESCTTELPHTRTMNRIIIPMPSGYLSNTKRFEKWHQIEFPNIMNFLTSCSQTENCILNFLKLWFLFLNQLAVGILTKARRLELCCVRFAILNYLPLATSNSANSFKYVWILTMDSWLDALYAADVS